MADTLDIKYEFERWMSQRGESAVYIGDGMYSTGSACDQFEAFAAGCALVRAALASRPADEDQAQQPQMVVCAHAFTKTKISEAGSWCCDCGVKVFDIEPRECQGCASHKRLPDGSICTRHLMAVAPTMHVTYRLAEGSCFVPEAGGAALAGDQ